MILKDALSGFLEGVSRCWVRCSATPVELPAGHAWSVRHVSSDLSLVLPCAFGGGDVVEFELALLVSPHMLLSVISM